MIASLIVSQARSMAAALTVAPQHCGGMPPIVYDPFEVRLPYEIPDASRDLFYGRPAPLPPDAL